MHYLNQTQIDTEREALERKLAELDDAEQTLASMTPDQILAQTLHESWCRFNHTDGCGWMYEMDKSGDNWGGSAHTQWLNKARKIIAKFPGLTTQEVLEIGALFR